MTHTAKLARDETITDALRAANDAIGDEEPTPQAFRIIAAIKAMRDDKVRIAGGKVDYLEKVQQAAQRVWREANPSKVAEHWPTGPDHTATAGIETPLGRLKCTTFKRIWRGKRGQRFVWASEYTLNDEPITVAEIRKAGLAQRPTTRNRQSKKERQ